MDTEIQVWREHASQLGSIGRGGRYPREMREAAVKLCQGFVAERGSVEGLAHKLGIAGSTLWTWMSRAAPAKEGVPLLSPVKVVADKPSSLAVRLRLGAAEADVSVEQLAELVRRLS